MVSSCLTKAGMFIVVPVGLNEVPGATVLSGPACFFSTRTTHLQCPTFPMAVCPGAMCARLSPPQPDMEPCKVNEPHKALEGHRKLKQVSQVAVTRIAKHEFMRQNTIQI